jgi:uncharacterized protein (DUF1697 family)
MKKFIALLRGINVSGQKKIKMSALKNLFEELSFNNVQTYIQSGNVLFTSKSINKKAIRTKIENKILEEYGYKVEVILKTPDEFKRAIKSNPFLKDKKKNSERIYFTFLSEKPSSSNIKILKDINYLPEQFIFDNDVIYLFFPNGYGKAKLNNNFFEKKLEVIATTRNYKTVETLYTLSNEISTKE